MKRNDFNTDVWERIEQHLHARREQLRDQLEGELTPEAAASVRGRIKEIKELLALPKKAAPVKVSTPLQDGEDD